MQYVFNERREYIQTIEFKNTNPILNVEKINGFKEEGVVGTIVKKEFSYSFDNLSWSPWTTLTSANIQGISFNDEKHFYLHVKFTRSNVSAGNIRSFYILYSSKIDTNPGFPISSSDAGTLNGEPGSYYLDLYNHYGGLPNNTLNIVNLGGGAGVHQSTLYDPSVTSIYLRSIAGQGAAVVTEEANRIVIRLDASFSGEVNAGRNIGEGDVSIYAGKSLEDLLFRTFKAGTGVILRYEDASTITIDVSILTKDPSLEDIYSSLADISISLGTLESSINDIYLTKQDVIPDGTYVKESSIGSGLVWNVSTNGYTYLDVSTVGGASDVSLNEIYAYLIELSTNTGSTDYTSNLFINDGDNHSTSLSNLDQIMGLIAPAKPDLLSGKDPSLGGTTKYTAKLPAGLASSWYVDASSGSTITSYIVDTTFRMYTPSFTAAQPTFRAGLYQDNSTAGILYALINDSSLGVYYDMTLGVGNVSLGNVDVSGYLRCSSIAGFGGSGSNFWRKGEAFIDITSQREGLVTYAFKHTEALTSNEASLYYDNVNSSPTFLVNGSANVLSDVSIYLSGIPHYGFNATFTTTYVAAAGIFRKAYHPTVVGRLSSAYGSNVDSNPATPPNVDASFAVSTTFTFNTANQSSGSTNAIISATIYKPTGTTATSTITLPRRVNTYSQTRATTTVEYFTDESRRIKDGSSGTDTTWIPSEYTIFNPDNGPYAQVQNGTLRYPVSADYASFAFSGTDKMYMRRFTKAATASGTLTFAGFNPASSISPYGSGNINILIWLTDQGLYFDLGREFGIGGGSGATMATAISAYSSLTSSAINWTLGTYSTGNEVAHVGTYMVIVIFRNTTYTMTQITAT